MLRRTKTTSPAPAVDVAQPSAETLLTSTAQALASAEQAEREVQGQLSALTDRERELTRTLAQARQPAQPGATLADLENRQIEVARLQQELDATRQRLNAANELVSQAGQATRQAREAHQQAQAQAAWLRNAVVAQQQTVVARQQGLVYAEQAVQIAQASLAESERAWGQLRDELRRVAGE